MLVESADEDSPMTDLALTPGTWQYDLNLSVGVVLITLACVVLGKIAWEKFRATC